MEPCETCGHAVHEDWCGPCDAVYGPCSTLVDPNTPEAHVHDVTEAPAGMEEPLLP